MKRRRPGLIRIPLFDDRESWWYGQDFDDVDDFGGDYDDDEDDFDGDVDYIIEIYCRTREEASRVVETNLPEIMVIIIIKIMLLSKLLRSYSIRWLNFSRCPTTSYINEISPPTLVLTFGKQILCGLPLGDTVVTSIPHICHFFTQAKFLESKIYTEKHVNYDKLHSKLPIFRVKSVKI